jgi:ribosomal protein L17
MRKPFLSLFAAASVLAAGFFRPLPAYAQGYPVLDIANLMQAINTLYSTYDHISQTIEVVQNTYKQLERQVEMIKNMDWSKVQQTFQEMDPQSLEGLLNMRHQIEDLGYYVDQNMNLINDVEDTLTMKTIKFGGKTYTFGGLFGFGRGSEGTTVFDLPKNIIDYVEETAETTMAGYEGRLTYRQKESLMRRYNLSPRNYAKIRLVEEQTNQLVKDLLTSGTDENAVALLTRAAENQKTIDALVTAAGQSMVSQQQVTTQALLNIASGLARLEIGIVKMSGFWAQKEIEEDFFDETMARQREIGITRRENERIKRTEYQKWF